MFDSLLQLISESGFAGFFSNPDGWRNLVMIALACVLLYLGIKKQYEPLLMVGIAVGCLLANVRTAPCRTPCIIRACGTLSWTRRRPTIMITATFWPPAD